MTDDRMLGQWLRRLGWSLGRLSPRDRRDIVAETRAHIEERVGNGAELAAVLAGFGPADRYARQFIDEMDGYHALGSQRGRDLARLVLSHAHRNLAAAATAFAVLALAVVAATALLFIVLKLCDPAHAGLWVSPGMLLLGVIDDPHAARDLLGMWAFPAAALVLFLALLLARLLLAVTAPRLLPRRPAAA